MLIQSDRGIAQDSSVLINSRQAVQQTLSTNVLDQNSFPSQNENVAQKPVHLVQKSVDSVQKQLNRLKETSVQMEYDKDIDRVIVKFVNKEDGEIIKQIPSEKFVEFEKAFVKTIGLLFDKKV